MRSSLSCGGVPRSVRRRTEAVTLWAPSSELFFKLSGPVAQGVRHHVRIRMHRSASLTHDLELAGRLGAADAWVQARVMVRGIDSHPSLRRPELAAKQLRHDLRDLVALRMAHGICKHVHLKVGGLPAKIGNAFVAETPAQARQSTPVVL